ncbi:MAG: UvrD-helicase domain-containing protein [Kiritimatiellia bacterium]|nr:UvrD-helicase domain-containing protein [Kiritimatiellia bacterium]MDP7022697.1 UvrD-helicase domain-containing protein [Kiritimatiellia bacterium]
MKPLGHMAISASAGSGKTFQLADRFVRLLAGGVPPDRIAALTFSRKAAGEIFDRIVVHLCDAAHSAEDATAVGKRIGLPDVDPDTFIAALRSLMDCLPRLHIGTLDSFIVGVLRAFPTELGLPPDFQMLDQDSSDAMQMRERVLDRIFNPLSVSDAIQTEFFEAFKQATYGTEEKNMERSLHAFVQDYRDVYQVLSDAMAWGDEGHIWPQGSPWLTPTQNVTRAAQELSDQITARNWPAKFEEGLLKIVGSAAAHTPASRWDSVFSRGTIMPRIMAQLDELARGELAVTYGKRTCQFDSEMCRNLLTVLRHMLGIELRKALRRTAGIHHLLDLFEVHYDALMRRSGSMTFADAQYLLTESNRFNAGACLSRMAGTEGRLYIDYRLDCALDHWLLDEFQDTSDLQWAVLRNLVDELLQDSSNTRSFFYVGDVKQAIYGWRGGNPHLFGEILADYGKRISEMPLATSYRSAPPVIETVNALFDALPDDRLPPAVHQQWERTWHLHDCAPHLSEVSGVSMLLEPECGEGQKKPTAGDRYATVAALLREIDPVRRGLETAILVRTNKTGRHLVDLLREACPDIPVTHEGKATLHENGVVALILALMAFAVHPGDTLAWRHIQMSPLHLHLRRKGLIQDSLSRALLSEIHILGFAAFIRTWGGYIDAACPLDAYGSYCLDVLVEAAILFDRTTERDPDAFRRYVESYSLPSSPTPGAVRVMTIHQSKGLGFDIVIVPELDGSDITRDSRRSVLLGRHPQTRQPDWVLSLPNRLVAEADSTLARTVEQADAESCFENLCVLYVAATRAKRALYLVTSYAGATAKSFTASAFVKQQLAGDEEAITIADTPALQLYACGRRDWYTDYALSPQPDATSGEPQEGTPSPVATSSLRPLQRLEPSGGDTTPRRAAWLFDEEARNVLDFGSAIHELFERIEWIDDADIESIITDWETSTTVSADVARDTITQFRGATESPEVRNALTRPDSNARLWREKRFHFVRQERLVSGVFDRVAITLDASGTPTGATILDYKSDRVTSDSDIESALERHREQLSIYAEALSRILALAPEQITCALIFTRPGRVVDVS